MPKDFKRAVASLKRAHEQGLSGEEAIMVAFEENARDLARVGGNKHKRSSTGWESRQDSSSICVSCR
jgi:hypothetical protein